MSDHRSLRHEAIKQHSHRIHEIRRAHGGAAESDEKADKVLVTKAIHEHDAQLHPGHHTRLKLKDGGHIEGHSGKRRLDRATHRRRADGGMSDADPAAEAMTRAIDAGLANSTNPNPAPQGRARGGRSPKGKAGHVNVIVATGAGQDRPVPMPVPGGAMPPHPPMAPPMGAPPPGGMMPPPGGGMPPGMPPGLARPPMAGGPPMAGPPGMVRARGGKVNDAGEAHGKELAFDMKAGSHSALGRIARSKMKVGSAVAAGD